MRVKGIIWVGSATSNRAATADFFVEHLGLRMSTNVRGFTQLTVDNGDRLELFGPESMEHELLDTGPVAGFWVEDIDDARRELVEAGVPEVTDFDHAPDGHRWFYFRAPDGNYYELCEHPAPRPPKGRHEGPTG